MRVHAVHVIRVDVWEHFPTFVAILSANREEPKAVPGAIATERRQNKIEVSRRYKFLLAFENNNQ